MSIVHDTQDTGVYFDPYDVGINADPYPPYTRLRDESPIYHNERFDFWALSRHADVERGLVNWQAFTNTRSDILDILRAAQRTPRHHPVRRGAPGGGDHVRSPAAARDAPGPHVARVHAAGDGRA